ncbi:hypothetical protein [Acinetobacter populi]|uniref:Uncharacterized protein n=1 Tax=Acinetobacter populi TaxID=1582270 RepID=A0A1Z9YTK2_9GAMM|nr:hypothetical protein [Acinetobacter populi]OUY05511.1 hypothetical protein CAP51_17015 [Acinetobacter populi]
MNEYEIILELDGISRYVSLVIGFLMGLLFSVFLFFKMKKNPRLIRFETSQGLQWLYRIGSVYYTREDYKRILKEEKPPEKFK